MSPDAPDAPCGRPNWSWDSSHRPACESGNLLLWTISELFHFISTYVYIILGWLTTWLMAVSLQCLCVFNSYFIFNPPVLTTQRRRSFPIVQTLQSLLNLNVSPPLNNFITSHHISYFHPLPHLTLFTPISSFLLISPCLVATVVTFPPVLP